MYQRLTLFCLIATIGFTAMPSANARAPVKAEDAFINRQVHLIELASILGSLHHMHQLCSAGDTQTKWRDRMQEMISLEVPTNTTRDAMVQAFNASYSATKQLYTLCDASIQAAARDLAQRGDALTSTLVAPFTSAP